MDFWLLAVLSIHFLQKSSKAQNRFTSDSDETRLTPRCVWGLAWNAPKKYSCIDFEKNKKFDLKIYKLNYRVEFNYLHMLAGFGAGFGNKRILRHKRILFGWRKIIFWKEVWLIYSIYSVMLKKHLLQWVLRIRQEMYSLETCSNKAF